MRSLPAADTQPELRSAWIRNPPMLAAAQSLRQPARSWLSKLCHLERSNTARAPSTNHPLSERLEPSSCAPTQCSSDQHTGVAVQALARALESSPSRR